MTATHGEKREEESGPGGDVGGEQVVDVDSSLKKKNSFSKINKSDERQQTCVARTRSRRKRTASTKKAIRGLNLV